MIKTFTTQAIAQALGAKLIGDGNILIERITHPSDATSDRDLALAMDPKLLPLLNETPVRAAVISAEAELEPGLLDATIIVTRPRLALAKLTDLFERAIPLKHGIHPTAVIEDGAQLGEDVTIGAFAYVGTGAAIGANSVIHPHVSIAPDAVLGHDCLIHAGVRIGMGVKIGDRAIIHFNSSIGADGFSFVTPQVGSVEDAKASGKGTVAATNQTLLRIASLAAVEIGDDVEIGANTSIDRGTVAATRIGNGTKIDNQVQIGHNVQIGENCLICGRTGIAGSAVIGNRVVLGGATGVADHVKVGDDAVAMAMSGIAGNVPPRTVVGGIPAAPRERTMENLFNISRIKHLIKKIDALAERLGVVEGSLRKDGDVG